jgi:hypothetical protein
MLAGITVEGRLCDKKSIDGGNDDNLKHLDYLCLALLQL